MEFTGVYWVPLFEVLERTSIRVCLVNGAHVKGLPGRKTDVADCMWLAELHAHGLLRPGFVPPPEIRRLRDYMRLREGHVTEAASHVQRAQKAMELMNIKVHDVISDMTGVSGQRVIQAILAGERRAEVLAALCDQRILEKKRQRLLESLEGTWAEQHLFALRQAWKCWEFCQELMRECDREIQGLLPRIPRSPEPPGGLPEDVGSKPKRSKNAPQIEGLHESLIQVLGGRNPTRIIGIGDHSLLQLISEVGTDLSLFPTKYRFTSWLGLAPGTNHSGKRQRNRSRKGGRAGQIFRVLAQTAGQAKDSALGSFYRRIRAQRGGLVANKALARKLAELFYDAMTKGMMYVEIGMAKAEQRYREQALKRLQRLGQKLGYTLHPKDEPQPAP
jgi:transposase